MGNYSIKPRKDGMRIWVHAVSVGEVIAALPILKGLKERLPEHEVVLSVTTSSGHQTATDRAAEWVHQVVYFPVDTPYYQLRAMLAVRPKVVAIMETELWFNFLWAAKEIKATTLLINGRISDRSYPRSRRLKFFYRPLLAMLDRALMQTETDRLRIQELGAQEADVFGNAKFDEALPEPDSVDWIETLGLERDVPVVVIGSTRGEAEESFLLEALPEGVQIVHAPRHLERSDALEQAYLRRFGRCSRRSRGEKGSPMILDTYGELSRVYSVADLVIVGGGFDDLGGQNILQPLAHGKPVLHGVHMQNFAAVAEAAIKAGASIACSSPGELRTNLADLLTDAARRAAMGSAAERLIHDNSGAAARYVDAIVEAAQR
ncbi:MAG: 3-deoxy-D-manno-octulosonic acid transferase [Fimbriimonadaceae bacterium]|nr:3-deoxy-D-manno-octulosonic acid transferase [Fimbriimonadaceae bacterium]